MVPTAGRRASHVAVIAALIAGECHHLAAATVTGSALLVA